MSDVLMQALTVISSVVLPANQICDDIANMDYKHTAERTKIDGQRLLMLIYISCLVFFAFIAFNIVS